MHVKLKDITNRNLCAIYQTIWKKLPVVLYDVCVFLCMYMKPFFHSYLAKEESRCSLLAQYISKPVTFLIYRRPFPTYINIQFVARKLLESV